MSNQCIFPQAEQILDEAKDRHGGALSYAYEAITLAHEAYNRQLDLTAGLVPGIPSKRRVRNDVSDDSWRFLKSIGQPLIDSDCIREFKNPDGGELMVLPDGLTVRIKKANQAGETSNYATPKIVRMDEAASRYSLSLFPEASELDQFIMDGHGIDVIFVVGDAMAEFTQIMLKFSAAKFSPFVILDQPTDDQLGDISPTAFGLVNNARKRLAN